MINPKYKKIKLPYKLPVNLFLALIFPPISLGLPKKNRIRSDDSIYITKAYGNSCCGIHSSKLDMLVGIKIEIIIQIECTIKNYDKSKIQSTI